MKYRAEIDGLRAIAVVPVVLFHAGFEFARSGFVGVDVFFVISGYLITTILLNDIQNKEFSIWQFYERRARRILPALLFVILTVIPFAWIVLTPSELREFSQSIVAVALFSSNFLFWAKSDYFSPEAEETILLHTWSLSVEEQFYIFFPPLLFLLWRFGPRAAFTAILGIAVLSLGLAEWGWRYAPTANFYLAPFRAWELAAGSLAAFVVKGGQVRNVEWIAALGLAMVLASNVIFDATTPFPSVYTLLPVIGVVLLILFGGDKTLTGRILGNRALVGIGLISYSAYLWHQPLFALVRVYRPDHSSALMLGLCVVTFVLAVVSWKFVEQPFRGKAGLLQGRAKMLSASACALVAFAAVGALGHVQKGFPDRFEIKEGVNIREVAMATRFRGYCFYSFTKGNQLPIGAAGHGCMLHEAESDGAPSVLLFGDSFAAHWDPFWRRFGEAAKVNVESITTNWCFPASTNASVAPRNHPSREQCEINRRYVSENADKYETIVLAGAWSNVTREGFTEDVFAFVDSLLENSSANIVLMDTPVSLKRASVERALYRPRGGTGNEDVQLILNESREALSRTFWREVESGYGDEERVFLATREVLFGKVNDYTLNSNGIPYSLEGIHISILGAVSSFDELLNTDDYISLRQFAQDDG